MCESYSFSFVVRCEYGHSECRPRVGLYAVGWPRLGFCSLRPDFVDQGLANVRVLGSHCATEKKFDIFPKNQFHVNPSNLDEASDPYARFECRSPYGHAVGCDHLDSAPCILATDKNLPHLLVWNVSVVDHFAVVELNERRVGCSGINREIHI